MEFRGYYAIIPQFVSVANAIFRFHFSGLLENHGLIIFCCCQFFSVFLESVLECNLPKWRDLPRYSQEPPSFILLPL